MICNIVPSVKHGNESVSSKLFTDLLHYTSNDRNLVKSVYSKLYTDPSNFTSKLNLSDDITIAHNESFTDDLNEPIAIRTSAEKLESFNSSLELVTKDSIYNLVSDPEGLMVIIPALGTNASQIVSKSIIIALNKQPIVRPSVKYSEITNFEYTGNANVLNDSFQINEICSSLSYALFVTKGETDFTGLVKGSVGNIKSKLSDYLAAYSNKINDRIRNGESYPTDSLQLQNLTMLRSNLSEPDSALFKNFISYMNATFRTDIREYDDAETDTEDDGLEVADSNKVHNDKIQFQVNRRDTVSEGIKMAIAMCPKRMADGAVYKNPNTGLPVFLTLNSIWGNLVTAHANDTSVEAYYNSLKAFVDNIEPSLKPIFDKFVNDEQFKNGYIKSLNLACTERIGVLLGKSGDGYKVDVRLNNRGSSIEKVSYDNIKSQISSMLSKPLSKGTFNDFITLKTTDSPAMMANTLHNAFKVLDINISEKGLITKVESNKTKFLEEVVYPFNKVVTILNTLKQDGSDSSKPKTATKAQQDDIIKSLYPILKLNVDLLATQPELATLNADNKLVQTPHYPSYVTDLFNRESNAKQIIAKFNDLMYDPRAIHNSWMWNSPANDNPSAIFNYSGLKYFVLEDGNPVEKVSEDGVTAPKHDYVVPILDVNNPVNFDSYSNMRAALVDGLKNTKTSQGSTYDLLMDGKWDFTAFILSTTPYGDRNKYVNQVLHSSDSATTYCIGRPSFPNDLLTVGKSGINTQSTLYKEFSKIAHYALTDMIISKQRMFDANLKPLSKFTDTSLYKDSKFTVGDVNKVYLHKTAENTFEVVDGMPSARVFQFEALNDGDLNFAKHLLAFKDESDVTYDTFFKQDADTMRAMVDAALPSYLELLAAKLITDTESVLNPLIDDLLALSKVDENGKVISGYYSDKIGTSNYIHDKISEYALNRFIFNANANHNISGDKGEYKGANDYNKRNGAPLKRGETAISEVDRKYNVTTGKDIELTANTPGFFDTQGKTDLKNEKLWSDWKSAKINYPDGFSVITLTEYIERLTTEGTLDQYSDIIEILKNPNGKLTPNQSKRMVESLKYFMYSRHTNSNDPTGRSNSYQFKNSIMVLSPAMHNGTQWGDLLDWMTKYNIQQHNFESATKTTDAHAIQLHDPLTGRFVDPFEGVDEETAQEILAPYIRQESRNQLRSQLKIPTHLMNEDVKLSIQLPKQLFLNVNLTDKYVSNFHKQLIGKEVFDNFQYSYVETTRRAAEEVMKELGFTEDKVDKRKLLDYLRKMSANGTSTPLVEDTIKDIANNHESALPFDSTPAYGKLMSILTAKISNNVTKMKLPGVHTTLIPDVYNGLSNKIVDRIMAEDVTVETKRKHLADAIKANKAITYTDAYINQMTDDIVNGREPTLRDMHDYKNGELVYKSQIIVSRYNDAFYNKTRLIKYDLEREAGKLRAKGFTIISKIINPTTQVGVVNYKDRSGVVNSRSFNPIEILEPIDINELSKNGVLTGVGTRIPGEGKHSMIIYEIVGFSNSHNTQVIAPAAMIRRTGWDFDADSLYMYYQNIENGKVIPFSTSDSELDTRYNAAVKEHLNNVGLSELSYESKEKIVSKLMGAINLKATAQQVLINNFSKYSLDEILNKLEEHLLVTVANSIEIPLASDSKFDQLINLQNELSNPASKLNDDQRTLIQAYSKAFGIPVEYNISQDENLSQLSDIVAKTIGFQSKSDFGKLSIYQQNSVKANQNNMIDSIQTILSSEHHAAELYTPNAYDNISKVSNEINASRSGTKDSNPNSVAGETMLRNINIGTRNLKGICVSLNNVVQLFGTINAKINGKLAPNYLIPTESLDQSLLNSQHLDSVYGSKNWELINTPSESYLSVHDRNLGSNNNSGWTDINNELISTQLSEMLSNILDAVKYRLGYNLNDITLPVAFLLSASTTVFNKNRFEYSMYFIHQPIIVKGSSYARELSTSRPDMTKGLTLASYSVLQDFIKYCLPILPEPVRKNLIRGHSDAFRKLDSNCLTDEYLTNPIKDSTNTNPSKVKLGGAQLKNLMNAILEVYYKDNTILGDAKTIASHKTILDAVTLKELHSGIETPDKSSINYYASQFKTLSAFVNYQTIAANIQAIGRTLKVDSLGAGPDIQVSKKLIDNIIEAKINFKRTIENLFENINNIPDNYSTEKKALENRVIDLRESYQGNTNAESKVNAFVNEVNALEDTIESLSSDFKSTNNAGKLIIVNGKSVAEAVYPTVFESTAKLEDSILPYLAASMKYSNQLALDLFAKSVIFQHPSVARITEVIVNTTNFASSDNVRREVNQFLQTNFMRQTKFFNNINDVNLLNSQVATFDITSMDSVAGIDMFDELSVYDKLRALQTNPKCKAYYQNPIFQGMHVLQELQIRPNRKGKLGGLDTLKIRNDADLKMIRNSLLQMYKTENNPFFKSFVEDLFKYAFIVEGFRFSSVGIAKYLPVELFYNYDNSETPGLLQQYSNDYFKIEAEVFGGDYMVTSDMEQDMVLDYHRRDNYANATPLLRSYYKLNHAGNKNSMITLTSTDPNEKPYSYFVIPKEVNSNNLPNVVIIGNTYSGLTCRKFVVNPELTVYHPVGKLLNGQTGNSSIDALNENSIAKYELFLQQAIANGEFDKASTKSVKVVEKYGIPELLNFKDIISNAFPKIADILFPAEYVAELNKETPDLATLINLSANVNSALTKVFESLESDVLQINANTTRSPEEGTSIYAGITPKDLGFEVVSGAGLLVQLYAIATNKQFQVVKQNQVYDFIDGKFQLNKIVTSNTTPNTVSDSKNDSFLAWAAAEFKQARYENFLTISTKVELDSTETTANALANYLINDLKLDESKVQSMIKRLKPQLDNYFNGNSKITKYAEITFEELDELPRDYESSISDYQTNNPDVLERDAIIKDAIARGLTDITVHLTGEFNNKITQFSNISSLINKAKLSGINIDFVARVTDDISNMANYIKEPFIVLTNNNQYLEDKYSELKADLPINPVLAIKYAEVTNEETDLPDVNNMSNAEKMKVLSNLINNNIVLQEQLHRNHYSKDMQAFTNNMLNTKTIEQLGKLNYNLANNAVNQLNSILEKHISKLKYDYAQINKMDIPNIFKNNHSTKAVLASYLADAIDIFAAQEFIVSMDVYEETPGLDELSLAAIRKLNQSVKVLQDNYARLNKLKNAYTDLNHVYVANTVYNISRNDKLVTKFGKELEQLSDDWAANGEHFGKFNMTNITNPETRDTISKLLTQNTDITSACLQLDSIYDSGVPLVDNMLKDSLIDRHLASQRINGLIDRFVTALNEVVPSAKLDDSYNKQRVEYFKKFVDLDNVGLISNHNWKDFNDSYYNQMNAIYELESEAYGLTQTPTGDATLDVENANKADALKKQARALEMEWLSKNTTVDVNNLESNLVGEAEIQQLRDLQSNDRDAYYNKLQNSHYHLVGRNANRHNVSYIKLTPTDKYRNTKYDALKPEDLKFLNTFRELVAEICGDNFSFFTPNDEFLPMLVNEKALTSLLHILGVNAVSNDTSRAGVNNIIAHRMNAPMVSVPNWRPVFDYDEGTKKLKPEIQQETIDRFNKFAKELKGDDLALYNQFLKFSNLTEVTTLKQIDDYNKYATTVNRKLTGEQLDLDPYHIMLQFATKAYDYGWTMKSMDSYRILRSITSSNSFEATVAGTKRKLDKTRSQTAGKAVNRTRSGEQTNINKMVVAHEKTLMRVPMVTTKVEQFVNTLRGSTSVIYMHGNLLAGINNISVGLTRILDEAKANEFIDDKSLKAAIKAYLGSVTDIIAGLNTPYTDNKEVAFIKHFALIFDDKNESLYDKSQSNALNDTVYKLNNFGYLSNNIGEHFMQFSMLLAASRSHRVIGGRILTYNQYIHSLRMTVLNKELTPEQNANLNAFIEENNKNLKDPNAENDFVRDWIVQNKDLLSNDQVNSINKQLKEAHATAKKRFESYKTVHELSTIKNGRLSFEGTEITDEELANFGRKVQKINHYLHGIYNHLDRSVLRMTVYGELASQFRKWMKPSWDRMYGAKFFGTKFNEGTQVYQHGSFAAFFNMYRKPWLAKYAKEDNKIIGAINATFYAAYDSISNAQLYLNTMTPAERSACLRQLRDIQILLGLTVGLVALGALAGGDDEDKAKAIRNNPALALAFFAVNSAQADLGQLYPMGWVPGILRTQKNLLAGQSVLLKTYKLAVDAMKYPFQSESDRLYHSGIYRNQNKVTSDLQQLTPSWRQYNKMANLNQYVGYYKMYNPFAVSLKN